MLKVSPKGELFDLFKDKPEVNYVFKSMLAGNTPCEIYVDDDKRPLVIVIWDTKHTLYFGGENVSILKKKSTIRYVKEKLLSDEDKKILGIGKLYYSSKDWKGTLMDEFKGYENKIFSRQLYKHSGYTNNENNIENISSSVKIEEITGDILNNDSLKNLSQLLDEINGMWGSKELFLKNGFGYCTIFNKAIVGWCTAEYMSDKSCGCGVETIENHRKKGYATLMAKAVAKKAKELDLDLYWDSWSFNEGSIKTAKRSRFTNISNYDVILIKP